MNKEARCKQDGAPAVNVQTLPTSEQLGEYKVTAVDWALNFTPLGVPSDLTTADAQIQVRPRRRESMKSLAPLSWIEWEYTVTLRGGWAVDLDVRGDPIGEPYKTN